MSTSALILLETDPKRHDYRSAASRIDADLYIDVYKFWQQKAAAVHNQTGANMTFTIQPIPANIAAVGEKNGGNPLGIPKVNHQCSLFTSSRQGSARTSHTNSMQGGPHLWIGRMPRMMTRCDPRRSLLQRNGRNSANRETWPSHTAI